MISEDLRKTLLGIVDWQLESEETGYVKEAYEKLLSKGFCPIGAKNTIASVLSKEIYIVVGKEKKGFSEESYRAGLEEMLKTYRYNRKETWPEAAELLKQGARLLRENHNNPEALVYWEELWKMIKAAVDYEIEKREDNISIWDFEDETGERYKWSEWISQMRKVYEESKQFKNCLQFIEDVNEIFCPFDWGDDTKYEYKVEEMLWKVGRYKEAKQRVELLNFMRNLWALEDAQKNYRETGNKGKVESVLEQILEDRMKSKGYRFFRGYFAHAASEVGRDDLCQRFYSLENQEYM